MQTHRLKLELSARKDRASFSATLWRASAVAFEVGLFEEGAALSLADVSSITMRVRKARLAEAVMLETTVAAASFTSCTAVQWAVGTHQHLSFDFTSEEMNLTLGSKLATLHVTFSALLLSGSTQVLAVGEFIFHDANAVPGEVSEGAGNAITLEECDARFLRYDGKQPLTEEEQLQAQDNLGIESGGVTDHGALTGLANDDHTQYHNDARGDARYAALVHGHAQSDVTGLAAALAAKAAASHSHAQTDITNLVADLAAIVASIATKAGLGANTFTGKQIVPAGSAAVPALQFLDGVGNIIGMRGTSASIIVSLYGGDQFAFGTPFNGSAMALHANARLEWSSTASPTGTPDVFLLRAGAGSLQLGATAASPVAQTLKGPDGSGTNIVAGSLTIAPGKSTGNATPAPVIICGGYSGSSGSTPQGVTPVLTVVDSQTIEIASGANLKFQTSTGTMLGTQNYELFSFWGATPQVQPSGNINDGVSGGGGFGGSSVYSDTTFDGGVGGAGYTIGGLIAALKAIGILG